MIGFGRRRNLRPGEMFPAGDPAYRVSFPRLRSGIKVRVVERGDPSSPPIVLVHGWGCSAYVFRRNMPALAAAGFRAIAVDLKGHGLSDKPLALEEYLAPSQFPEFSLAMRELLHSYDWNAADHRHLVRVGLPAVGVWGSLDH